MTVTASATVTSRTTRNKIVAVVVVGVILIIPVVMGVWMLHHVDRYLPRMIAYVHKKMGLQVEIRHATVNLFPVSVRLYDFGIRNPTPFPQGYFLKVPRVDAILEAAPLLHRQIVIQSLVLDQPVVNFISDPDGLWNFQPPGQSPQKPTRLSIGSVASIQVNKGILLASTLIEPRDQPGPVIFEMQKFSGRLDLIASRTSRNPTPSRAMAGSLDGDAARFGDIHLKNVHSEVEILPEQLTFKNFNAQTYRGTAAGYLTFNFAGRKTKFDTTLQATGVGVPYLLAEFQKGPPAMTGMMAGKINLGGEIEQTNNPLAGIQGTGIFTIRNGGFPSLAHSKKMAEMKRFRNPDAAAKPLSAFSSFAGDVELRNHRIYNKHVALDLYGIDVDGSGHLNEASGALNYSGAATIMKKQGIFTTTLAKMFKKAKEQDGRLKFPIRLTGTLNNPQFAVIK